MDVVDFTPADVDTTIATACSAAAILRSTSPLQRGEMLRSGADALEAAGAELIELGRRETNYVEARMRSELARTCYQLRFFAGVVEEGSFVDATIDHVDPDWALGARPDIRRQMVPLGPVVVFAAGNFPFAFSVAGGETASAIAAGCPVVLKVHPDHPMLSVRTGELFDAGLRDAGAPAGTIGLIHGVDAGRQALLDPRITAVAFTGSTGGGRALYDLARSRPVPIPFFGELGSINPTFVTPAATRARGAEIINGYVSSFTLGVGQFCTKPGLLFLPSDHGLTAEAVAAVERVAPVNMTAARIRDNHREGVALLQNRPGVRTLVDGAVDEGGVSPTLLVTTAADVIADPSGVLDECFGPSSIIVECDDWGQTCAAAELVPGALTSTVHAEPSDVHLVRPLLDVLQQRSGRVIWNDWPTGVAVTWAMVHGGPYPSSTSAMYTSVGSAAMARFLRPVCYQNFPADLLPPSVAEHNPWTIPQRVDGTLTISHDDIASENMSAALPDGAARLLDGPNFGYLATLMESGAPKVEPVWVAREEHRVLIVTDAASIKAKNIHRDSRVALTVVAREQPYEHLLLRGRVVEVRPDDDMAVLDWFSQKYLGAPYPRRRWNSRIVIVIEPSVVRYHAPGHQSS